MGVCQKVFFFGAYGTMLDGCIGHTRLTETVNPAISRLREVGCEAFAAHDGVAYGIGSYVLQEWLGAIPEERVVSCANV